MPIITLPNTIQNNDVSDADKLMSNLNAIVTEYNSTIGNANGKIIDQSTPQTMSGKTLVNSIITGSTQTVVSHNPVIAGTTNLDLSAGNVHMVTMPADTQTLSISNGVVGKFFAVEIINTTGQGALTWFTTINWVGGTAPTFTGTNGKKDTFMFRVTGASTYDGYIVGMNI